MSNTPLPERNAITIHFAHVAYRLAERFALRETGIGHFQTWTPEETTARIGEADVLVLSGLWRPELLAGAGNLKFTIVPQPHMHDPENTVEIWGVAQG